MSTYALPQWRWTAANARRSKTRKSHFLLAVPLVGALGAGLAQAGEDVATPKNLPPPAAKAVGAKNPPAHLLTRIQRSTARVMWRDRLRPSVITRRNAVAVDAEHHMLMAGPPPEASAGAMTVTHQNGFKGRAHVVASDTESALTLLRLPKHGLPAIALRGDDPSELGRTGERVALVNAEGAVAFGALRSWGTRVTVRHNREPRRSLGLLEAGLATVGDDLGSPVIDSTGRVVGLFLAHRTRQALPSPSGSAQGGLTPRPNVVASYAVPSATIALVWPLLRDRGRVPRAALGVHVVAKPAPAELREHLCAGCPSFIVTRVGASSPGGLQQNDVIVSFNDRRLPEGASLEDALLPFRPGDEIRLDVVRSGKTKELVVRLRERRITTIVLRGGIQIHTRSGSPTKSKPQSKTKGQDEGASEPSPKR